MQREQVGITKAALFMQGLTLEQLFVGVAEAMRPIIRHELNQLTTLIPAAEAERKPLTAKELAAIYGVCQATIWEWCRVGKFPSHKIGSRTYFYADEVAASLETKHRSAKPARTKKG